MGWAPGFVSGTQPRSARERFEIWELAMMSYLHGRSSSSYLRRLPPSGDQSNTEASTRKIQRFLRRWRRQPSCGPRKADVTKGTAGEVCGRLRSTDTGRVAMALRVAFDGEGVAPLRRRLTDRIWRSTPNLDPWELLADHSRFFSDLLDQRCELSSGSCLQR